MWHVRQIVGEDCPLLFISSLLWPFPPSNVIQLSWDYREKTGSTVRFMFFDFFSSFNTIKPLLLWDKLQRTRVDHHLSVCIPDYLTNRPQYVRIRGSESAWRPHKDLFWLQFSSPHRPLTSKTTPLTPTRKFSKDSAIVDLISASDDREYSERN